MTRIYSVHVQLPRLAKAMCDALEDLYDVDTVRTKDAGHIYIDSKVPLTEANGQRLCDFCNGFRKATECVSDWA